MHLVIAKKGNSTKFQTKIMRYVNENWGSPLIFSFIFLLFSVAVLLAAGWVFIAEPVATFAYFVLAAGVVLQLLCLSKNKKKN